MHPGKYDVYMTAQVIMDFALSEQMYAKARVADVSSVALWLGADVMLEYPLEEAKQLLVGPHRTPRHSCFKGACEHVVMQSYTDRACCGCSAQSTNLQNARDNLKRNAEDMELIKDFSTTTEVCALSGG